MAATGKIKTGKCKAFAENEVNFTIELGQSKDEYLLHCCSVMLTDIDWK